MFITILLYWWHMTYFGAFWDQQERQSFDKSHFLVLVITTEIVQNGVN